eukprot:XP_017945115.1 PREDICTED: uncharacterized protein LOC101732015 [Xenopus tropicalis]
MLSEANLRLHKIASNSTTVMKAFQTDDHATEFKDLNLGIDNPPIQRSLGLRWDLLNDTFGFQVTTTDKPFTRCGVLSVVNSLYDPLGFVAPITIQGKSLLRQLSETVKDWDTPLPTDKQLKWESLKQSLKDLEELHIPRCYTSTSLAESQRREIHVFSDASTEAIAVVAYLKLQKMGVIHFTYTWSSTGGLLFGQLKVIFSLAALWVTACSTEPSGSDSPCRIDLSKPKYEYKYIQDGDIIIGGVFSVNCEVYKIPDNRWKYIPLCVK